MRFTASAPGKLVLLGEYAVLEGAPALVQAVDRRARVTLDTLPGDTWEIVSPTLDLEVALRVRTGRVEWRSRPPAELAWLAPLFEQLPFAAELRPCHVELDSDPFFFNHPQRGHGGKPLKLGLGSSAALTTALLGALHELARRVAPNLEACITAHRAIQHGHGSGIDIAASLAGGLSHFQRSGDTPQARPVQLPDGLHWCCVFSGRAASTGAMLAAVAAWREREPDHYAHRMDELVTISSRGIDAVAIRDAAAFLSSLHDYAQALARFGEASGVDIASRGHRTLGAIAVACGVVYKSCGAGGGDVGVTFAVDDRQLRDFVARATQAGFPVIDLVADPRGLETNVVD